MFSNVYVINYSSKCLKFKKKKIIEYTFCKVFQKKEGY